MTITPSADQKRAPDQRPRARDRLPMVACSRMIAAGASRSFVDSHSISGKAASTTRTVRTTATGSATTPMPMIADAGDGDGSTSTARVSIERVADEAPGDGLDPRHSAPRVSFSATRGVRDLAHDDALHDDAQGSRRPRPEHHRRAIEVSAIDPAMTASNSSVPALERVES